LESIESELLLQSICAVVKSDGYVHQKESESITVVLNRYDNEFRVLDINPQTIAIQFAIAIQLKNKKAADHFNTIVNLLNENKSYKIDFLNLVLKIIRNIASVVNQMNKSELVMLSRLESIFKKYLS
jgi:hypothetical protein